MILVIKFMALSIHALTDAFPIWALFQIRVRFNKSESDI